MISANKTTFFRMVLFSVFAYGLCGLFGCAGSLRVDSAFRIKKSQERPGYPYVVELSSKEVGYFNAHLMRVGREEAEYSIVLFFSAREGTFRGEDIPHSQVGPLRGKVVLTKTDIVISLEAARVTGFGNNEKVESWNPFEFNGRYKLISEKTN